MYGFESWPNCNLLPDLYKHASTNPNAKPWSLLSICDAGKVTHKMTMHEETIPYAWLLCMFIQALRGRDVWEKCLNGVGTNRVWVQSLHSSDQIRWGIHHYCPWSKGKIVEQELSRDERRGVGETKGKYTICVWKGMDMTVFVLLTHYVAHCSIVTILCFSTLLLHLFGRMNFNQTTLKAWFQCRT